MSFFWEELGEPFSWGLGCSILQWILGLKSGPGNRAGMGTFMWQLPLPRAYPPSVSSDQMDGEAPFWAQASVPRAFFVLSAVSKCVPGYGVNLLAHHGT